MFRTIAAASLAFGLLFAPMAGASEEEAEVCVRTKVWDGYGQGWAIRTMATTSLADGKTRNYMVTLYAGNEYQIQACADSNAVHVDLLLYDLDGRIVARNPTKGREPSFTFKPSDTATYYVVVYAQKVANTAANTGVGVAISYR